ncbi:cupin domain-containing protein [Streptomyces sp. NPDC059010]|uniref:cupin domain-containing protein n=1 Tax=Streptomyces sp. NPDC059010 TaxID=3346695 RepID=UPI003680735D
MTSAEPRLLCDIRALPSGTSATADVLWKLTEAGRQLDANIVRLAPHHSIAAHREPELDVLVLVVSGSGVIGSGAIGGDADEQVSEGLLLWLPHGSTRSITAGADGLTCLTVHRRRPGMRIRPHGDAVRD